MIPFTISDELWDFIVMMGGDPYRLGYHEAQIWAERLREAIALGEW